MADRTRTILLRGGPGDGMTVAQVPEDAPHVDYEHTRYVKTGDEAPLPGDEGSPGRGGRRVVRQLPVYAAEQPA